MSLIQPMREAQWDFCKYHGLGNDYLVIDPQRFSALPPAATRLLCDRHHGLGADGLLWGPFWGALDDPQATKVPHQPLTPGVRIFNPDGGEAEKSGNGLRIFARHLHEREANERHFSIRTLGGLVQAAVSPNGSVCVHMGRVRFGSSAATDSPQAESLCVDKRSLTIYVVDLGNPHCVIPLRDHSEALVRHLGPQIEQHVRFPQRTNVQFIAPSASGGLSLAIWERGAGYTLASGSSACAAAAVAVRLGWCASPVQVEMPGGTLEIHLAADGAISQAGEVLGVYAGEPHPDLLQELQHLGAIDHEQ